MTQQKTEWTAQQRTYILWLALPRKDRKPSTQQELAKQLGVGRRTLVRWKQKPGLQDAVFGEVRRHLDWRLPEILRALGNKAEKGDVPAIKMALELTGRLKVGLTLTHEMREYGGDKLKKIWAEIKRFEEQLFGESEPGDKSAETGGTEDGTAVEADRTETDSRPEG